MKIFYKVLANSLIASTANNFAWFAVTFWVFLQTNSVIATSIMAGTFTITIALTGIFLGSLVDRYPKKRVMLLSSGISLLLYAIAGVIFVTTPAEAFTDPSSALLWVFVLLVLFGALAGNLRGIALSTLVTILVPADRRDRANGLVGTATGISFMVASVFSGLAIGFLDMSGVILLAILVTLGVIVHLMTLTIPDAPVEPQLEIAHSVIPVESHHAVHPGSHIDAHAAAAERASSGGVDLRGTIRVIALVPGLFGLIFFTTINNFLGGVYFSLMDAYGLMLVSVQTWGILWGVLSLGFIFGGLVVARRGLGANPLRTLLLVNVVMWTICIFFTIQASIVLLAVGMFAWLCLIPVVEAAEQTVLQKVVPLERQGRVFGFAQSVEQAASPISSFLIGPIAQIIFIPYMTTGAGVERLGDWFGTGADRGIALIFMLAGVVGLVVTLMAMRSNSYQLLSQGYQNQELETTPPIRAALPNASIETEAG